MNSLLQNLYDQESRIYDFLASDARFLDVLPDGTDAAEVYYRTDHHWTLQGAWLAYAACCRADGLPVYSLDEFNRSSFPGFFGTTRSRSGLPAFRGDMLECAEPKDPVILTADGETFDHLIFPGRAETYDGYAVYLDGNHGMTEILNCRCFRRIIAESWRWMRATIPETSPGPRKPPGQWTGSSSSIRRTASSTIHLWPER